MSGEMTQGTSVAGHTSFNDLEKHIGDPPSPHSLPTPGAQATGTGPLVGNPTGVKPPGWAAVKLRVLAGLLANPSYHPADGIDPSIDALSSLWADHLVAHYPAEFRL